MIADKENINEDFFNKTAQPQEMNKDGMILAFSPQKLPVKKKQKGKVPKTDSDSIPVLLCAPFQSTLWIGFGCVQLNDTITKIFELRNDNEKTSHIRIDDWESTSAARAGFSITFGASRTQSITINAKESVIGYISWTPECDQSVSESAILKLNDRMSLQITLHGVAGTGDKMEKVIDRVKLRKRSLSAERGRKPLADKSLNNDNNHRIRSSSLESLKDKNLVSKSIFKKNAKKSSGNSDSMVPLKKVLGDNKWVEKQIIGFTEWLNYNFNKNHHSNFKATTIAEDDKDVNENTEDVTDVKTMRQIAQRRADAKVRKDAYEKLHGLKNSLVSVHHEIVEGRIELRDDRDLLADLGLQETLLKLLFSYETPWLRLGLEVVFGEILSLPQTYRGSEATQWIKVIKTFIMERFLSDPEIIANKKKYTYHGTEDVTKTELRKHILKKFVALVLFLDTARNNQMLTLPTLFKKTSEIKSTKDYLSYFCKEFLKGEGDLVRHLATMQYNVSFSQTYIDEYDYTVTNLAIDLRDGVRIARLIELLTNKFDMSPLLRVPAVSRLQKLHNVGITVKYIKDSGIDANANTKTIVDGDRDKTLVFLWRIMYHFDLQKLINAESIQAEVDAIHANKGWRQSIYEGDDIADLAVSVNKSITCMSRCSSDDSMLSTDSKDLKSEALIKNLVKWCSSITDQYEVPVYNLTSCLADGRALCLLIHYYHPTLLPLNHIKKTTSNFDNLVSSMTSLDHFTEANVTVKRSDLAQAIANEHRNFATLKKSCTDIGGIPSMLPFYDSKNIPEEKTMVVFLGNLFARLVETSSIIRASIRIQRFVRNIYLVKIGKAIATKRALANAKKAVKKAAFVEKTKDNKFVTEVPVHVTMSDYAADNQAAITIARQVIAFMTRCRYLNYIADMKIEKELKDIKVDSFIVRKANYGIPKKSFSAFPLSNTERAERDRITPCPYTPSTPGDNETSYQLSGYSDRRQSDQFSQISDRTDLSNEFIMDDKAALALETVRSIAEKEADARAESRIKQIEEEKILQMRQAEEKAALVMEENEKKLYEQLLFSEAQFAEKERSVKMDAEIAALKAEGAIQAAAVDAEKKTRESQKEAERLVELEKQTRLAAEEQAREEKEAREAAEAKLLELEENASFEERMAQQAKEAAEELLEAEKAARIELEEQLCQEKAAADELIRIAEEAKLAAVMKVREETEAKLREMEQSQLAEKEARIALEKQLKDIQEKQLIDEADRLRLQQEKDEAEEKVRIAKARIEEEECKRIEAEKLKQLEEERLKAEMEKQKSAELAEQQRQADLEVAKAEAEARRLAAEEMEKKKLAEEEKRAIEAAKAQAEAAEQMQEQEHKKMLSAASTCITKFFRAFRVLFRARVLTGGFKRLQAVYKANIVRTNRGAKLSKIYQKLLIANANANANPELRLCTRTVEALSILQNGRMISQLFKACQLLELSTRISKKCSQSFSAAGAASILFSLIQSCNRSAPHQEILRYALVILLHVARHEELAPVVASAEHSTEVVIHLMQMFRDKGQIFCLSCELLCRLVVASENTKCECNSTTSRKCLEGILHIIETKHRLQSRVSAVVAKNKTFVDNACVSPKGKPKYLASEEPVNCVRHLMGLLVDNNESEQ